MQEPFAQLGGRAFCDILDGYFTLRESLRQMLVRNGFSGAWVTLLHAPVMHIEGLPADAPIPLHLRGDYAGMIEQMQLAALGGTERGVSLFAVGDWYWADRARETALPADIRLGEPAYVQGIGWGETSAIALAPRAGRGELAMSKLQGFDLQGAAMRWFRA
jgi:hypothetical protein